MIYKAYYPYGLYYSARIAYFGWMLGLKVLIRKFVK